MALSSDSRPTRAAALWGLVWLVAVVGLAALLLNLPEPWGTADPAAAAAAGLALTLPAAAVAIWASLARRLARQEAQRDSFAGRGGAPASIPDDEALTRTVAAATRDALEAERAAIARQLAQLGDAQRRLDAAVAALSASAPAEPEARENDSVRAEPEAGGRAPSAPAAVPASAPAPEPVPAAAAGTKEAPQAAVDAAPDTAQPSLPLADGASEPEAPIRDWTMIAAALDFPRDEADEAGFRALAEATRDRRVANLLQAAEDALTMLAQHGLYMEDLEVRPASADLWARFAEGERGADVAEVGGIRSEEAVESVRGMMKSDPVFRDTAMHLMRRFDGVLRRAADDPEGAAALPRIADSRTGRAFMLVAQSLGVFD